MPNSPVEPKDESDAVAIARAPGGRAKYEVIAESNGHHWIKAFGLVCCRDCGLVRRADDKNRPCKGVVKVGPRDAQ